MQDRTYVITNEVLEPITFVQAYPIVHISDCIETVHELPLLPNNTVEKHFYTNREQCEVLNGYLSLGRRPGGDWANT